MAKNKKSFVLYCDIIHTVNKLPDEQAGQLFKHVLAYVNDQDPEPTNPIIEIAFESIKRDLIKYEERCKKNRQNVLQRWNTNTSESIQPDTKGTNEYDHIQSNTTVCNRIQTNTNEYDRIQMNTKHTDSDSNIDIDIKNPPIVPLKDESAKIAELESGGIVTADDLSVEQRIEGLMDVFQKFYRNRNKNTKPYIPGQWDEKALKTLLKRTPYNDLIRLMSDYFKVDTNHTINEFSNNVSDGFNLLAKKLRKNKEPTLSRPLAENKLFQRLQKESKKRA